MKLTDSGPAVICGLDYFSVVQKDYLRFTGHGSTPQRSAHAR
jgi:hypothetical protein